MESDRNLWELPYYHGLLPREDTVAMLKANGEFLIRKSEENAGDARTFVLSVVYGNVKHYLFREEKGRISIDFKSDKGYKSIRDFVDSHLQSRQPVCSASHVIITRPIGRKDWELAHADIVNGAKLGAGAFGIVRRGELKQTGGTVKVAIKEATLTKCTKEQIRLNCSKPTFFRFELFMCHSKELAELSRMTPKLIRGLNCGPRYRSPKIEKS
uniref:SH2 domain-containing protein n=1 Tax=Meloidogyne enterolobii TaxID=390850 RepID=A0A6V7URW3_MELEN|nr:unnamed protein product [Meloidogyne enterolobii]